MTLVISIQLESRFLCILQENYSNFPNEITFLIRETNHEHYKQESQCSVAQAHKHKHYVTDQAVMTHKIIASMEIKYSTNQRKNHPNFSKKITFEKEKQFNKITQFTNNCYKQESQCSVADTQALCDRSIKHDPKDYSANGN